jgi:hypothetical protein
MYEESDNLMSLVLEYVEDELFNFLERHRLLQESLAKILSHQVWGAGRQSESLEEPSLSGYAADLAWT